MNGYVFVYNSSKPSIEKLESREPVKLTNFSRPCLEVAMELGYEVYIGENRNHPDGLVCDLPVKFYDMHTYRSIIAFKDNYIALKNLLELIKEAGNIKVIHCNTPIGGMIGRICGKKCRIEKVIYTAHGFHFYKGAPIFNRIVFKFAECMMAHWTDAIITMNEEDFQAAHKFKLKGNGKVFKVHGVGINLNEFENIQVNNAKKREELGLKPTDIVCISAGDLTQGKNYSVSIEAIAKTKYKNLHYLICGRGREAEKLKRMAVRFNISENVHFLGYRTDIKELLSIADIFLFSSIREGLPRSLMEAMACGLPCVVSEIRGNIDLIKNNYNGLLCDPQKPEEFANAILTIVKDTELCSIMGRRNREVIKEYDVNSVKREIRKIYQEILE